MSSSKASSPPRPAARGLALVALVGALGLSACVYYVRPEVPAGPPGPPPAREGPRVVESREIHARRVYADVIYAREVHARNGRVARVVRTEGDGVGQLPKGELRVDEVSADVVRAREIHADWLEANEVYAREVKIGEGG